MNQRVSSASVSDSSLALKIVFKTGQIRRSHSLGPWWSLAGSWRRLPAGVAVSNSSKRRNPVAEAHSKRGAAGAGLHVNRRRHRDGRAVSAQCECGEPLDESGSCGYCDGALSEWAREAGPDRLFGKRPGYE